MRICRILPLSPRAVPTVLAVIVLSLATAARGGNWPQWRGPFHNGSSAETNLPVRWSLTLGIAWTTPLPGKSGATPIIWENSVFLPSPDEAKNLRLLCFDSGTGKLRWEKVVAQGDKEIGKNNMASCSPVTDGTRVYALFGTSDFVAFDFAGSEVWRRELSEEFGVFAVQFLYGSSPLLFGGKLYLPLMQRNPPTYGHAREDSRERKSWLICLDPATGRTHWRQERPTNAPEEAMEAYTTPVPFLNGSATEIIVSGADCVTAHNPDSGAEQWRFSGLNLRKNPGGRIVPGPVTAPGLVFACGPKREALVALHAKPAEPGDTNRLAWRTTDYVPDVCTPLFYQGKLFVLDGDRQTMTCFKPETGEKIWQGKLGVREIFYSSPTGADGRVYCLSEEGTVVVLSAGPQFEVLSTIPMGGGPCGSSVAVAGGRLFVRTAKALHCIRGE